MKNHERRRKHFILLHATTLQGTGKTRAYERLKAFERLLIKNLKKTKKIKNKSARF